MCEHNLCNQTRPTTPLPHVPYITPYAWEVGKPFFSCTYRLLFLYSWYDYDMYDTVLIHEWYCKIHTISRQCDICDAARYEPPSRTKFSPSTWTYIISYIVLYHNFIVLYQIYITTPAMVKRYVYDMYMIRFWYNLRYASTHITSTHDTHHPIQTRYAHDTHCITTVTARSRYKRDTLMIRTPPKGHPASTPKAPQKSTICARYERRDTTWSRAVLIRYLMWYHLRI